VSNTTFGNPGALTKIGLGSRGSFLTTASQARQRSKAPTGRRFRHALAPYRRISCLVARARYTLLASSNTRSTVIFCIHTLLVHELWRLL
jgi:hypothetical protein